ncbi:MAG TPA: glutamate racemase [Ktedonobacteraceae bacterium]|nr:glutamate racemase [Ktedonobacteraceae bacterium]
MRQVRPEDRYEPDELHNINDIHPARDAERSQHPFDQERAIFHSTEEAPIGVFDSGAGGLTILADLRRELPDEHYIYFGDTANVPYGTRSDAEITALTLKGCKFLIDSGVKLIVVACNTASQAALNTLRATFAVPFIGVVPAVKPAARATRKGRIGVAATNQAAKAMYLKQLIDEFAGGIQVFAVGCPELVTLVEQGEFDGPVVEETVRQALQPLLAQDVDVIVLGCTHFPALRPVIERITNHQVQIIDSGTAIAHRTRAVLDAESHMRYGKDNATAGTLHVFCSGDAGAFSRVASSLLGYPVVAYHVNL